MQKLLYSDDFLQVVEALPPQKKDTFSNYALVKRFFTIWFPIF